MIGVYEAIQKAKDYALAVLGPDLSNLLIEGVETTDTDWIIILGFDTRVVPTDRFEAAMRQYEPREYKRFLVDGQTGQVKSMQMQTVAG